MKQGRTIQQLAEEIARQRAAARDFIADTRVLTFKDTSDIDRLLDKPARGLTLGFRTNGHEEQFGISDLAHDQIAARLGIPAKYYDKMREEFSALLAQNVNGWFGRDPEKRMVRTMDGRVRAFLSDRYRPLDNADLAEAVLPLLGDKGLNVESCEVTAKHLYIKAVNPNAKAEIKPGDEVWGGVCVRNSEVGCGALAVEPLVYRLICLNGLMGFKAFRKYHIGKNQSGDSSDSWELFKDETRQQSDKALWMQVQDVTESALSGDLFQQYTEKLRNAGQDRLTGDPVKAVEAVQKTLTLNDSQKGGVLRHLIEGGDLSRYGMVNAITRTSQDQEDYETATDMERMGGVVLELPKGDWAKIAEAA